MKRIILNILAIVAAGGLAAAQTATQPVGFSVLPIDTIAVAGAPVLTISSATAGTGLTSASNNSSTYSFTTNQTNRKITAALSSNMPTGLELKIGTTATKGSGVSSALLSTTAVNVVTGISQTSGSGGITYTLSATPEAGVIAADTRTVTFTLAAAN